MKFTPLEFNPEDAFCRDDKATFGLGP